MNGSSTFDSADGGLPDEPDDPGPSSVGRTTAQPATELRITGEAASEIDSEWLRDQLLRALRLLPGRVRKVNIQIVRDDRMTMLHERHMGVAETTDVLTFPAGDCGVESPIEADLALCLDEARWRADQYDHAVERELLLYALHGLLHCAGFDDQDEAGFAAMHAEEDRILESIGVGRTFAGRGLGEAGQDARATSCRSPEPDRGNDG